MRQKTPHPRELKAKAHKLFGKPRTEESALEQSSVLDPSSDLPLLQNGNNGFVETNGNNHHTDFDNELAEVVQLRRPHNQEDPAQNEDSPEVSRVEARLRTLRVVNNK